MSSDEIVWQIINQQFCSFKLKTTKEKNFCRNEYNVTGLCNRQSCPLANSRYATVRSNPDTGTLYLYMKTIERAHTPAKLWERIKLSQNYGTAFDQVNDRLKYWPAGMIHRCQQRLTRLMQVRSRMRRLAKEDERLGEKIVPKMAPKVRRREETRERKAMAAAKVERAIERELIERLRTGAYGDQPLNVNENIWKKVLKGLERQQEGDQEDDEEMEDEEEDEMEMEGEGEIEYVSDIGESEDEEQDMEDFEDWNLDKENGDDSEEEEDSEDSDEEDIAAKKASEKRRKGVTPKGKPKKSAKFEIEYEQENEPAARVLT